MQAFFEPFLGAQNALYASYAVLALAALIGLFILWRLFRMARRPRRAGGRRSKHARLAVTDAAAIDDYRNLVLVRRDDVEHLILIGPANDVVIESNIRRLSSARALNPEAAETATPPAPVAAPVATSARPAPAPQPEPVATRPAPAPAPQPVVSPPAPAAPVRQEPGLGTTIATGTAGLAAAAIAGGSSAVANAADKVANSAPAENKPEPASGAPSPTIAADKADPAPEQPKPSSDQAQRKSDETVASDISALLDEIAPPQR